MWMAIVCRGVGVFYVIVKTDCETDGSFAALLCICVSSIYYTHFSQQRDDSSWIISHFILSNEQWMTVWVMHSSLLWVYRRCKDKWTIVSWPLFILATHFRLIVAWRSWSRNHPSLPLHHHLRHCYWPSKMLGTVWGNKRYDGMSWTPAILLVK